MNQVSLLKSCPVALPEGMAQLAAQDREGTPLVVISIHPLQKAFVSNDISKLYIITRSDLFLLNNRHFYIRQFVYHTG